MSIRILGGHLSGLSLSVPKGLQTRPTSVMLRRKVFDAHQNLMGQHFYDLCAGTGAMGLEACSRGAENVFFIENHGQTLSILKRNIQLAKERLEVEPFDYELTLIKGKFQSYITLQFKKQYLSLDAESQKNTILFLDPPYEHIDLYEFFLSEVLQSEWFIGTSWIESDNKKGLMTSWWEKQGVKVQKVYQHSDSTLLITS